MLQDVVASVVSLYPPFSRSPCCHKEGVAFSLKTFLEVACASFACILLARTQTWGHVEQQGRLGNGAFILDDHIPSYELGASLQCKHTGTLGEK